MTQSEFGGAQRFIYTLISGFTRMKTRIDADIIVAAGPDGDDENGLLRVLEKRGINTRHLKYLRRAINPFFDLFLGLMEIHHLIKKEKPDILFLCSSKAGAMGSLIGRLIGVRKIIYRIGGWAFNDPRSFLSKLYYRSIEKVSARWKHIIVNNAESDRKQAIKSGIKPRERIITIYNGIGNLEFLSKEKAREFLKLRSSDFVVGTIANDYPSKGLKYLKKAMENIDGRLVIIGKGNIYIPDAYKYLKAFDVFVLSSLKEGFPWTILEAIKAEIPVVATCVGAVPEIIDPSTGSGQVGILVEPGNPKELAKAIRKLITDEDLRKKLASNAIKLVAEKFTLNKMIKKYEDLFSFN